MRPMYLTLLAAVTYLATMVGCDSNRPIYDASKLREESNWTASCSLQKRENQDAPSFEMKSWFDNGHYADLQECEFPNADKSGSVGEPHPPFKSQFEIYWGSDALARAKEDFDNCSCLDTIVITSDHMKKGSKPISPWTLNPISGEEIQKMANIFSGQRVGIY